MVPKGEECRLVGIPAAEGVTAGTVHLMAGVPIVLERTILAGEVSAELQQLNDAIRATEAHFDEVGADFEAQGKGSALELVGVYRLMLNSPEIADEARRYVRLAFGADWAVHLVTKAMKLTFDAMEDSYLRERGRDVQAVGEQLIRTLNGLPSHRPGAGDVKGSVAVAFDFSPLEVARLEADGVVGLVSETGGRSSHAAILARSYGIPFVVGVVDAGAALRRATKVVIDGTKGTVVGNPTPATLEELDRTRERSFQLWKRAREGRAQAGKTLDDVVVALNANIESLRQIPKALEAGAESIGLFRTEFLYLGRADLPGEEEQYRDACAALAACNGRPITFRTLDLGGDKLPLAVKIPEGNNPALGVRAIRFSFQREDLFRTQLRALHRAALHGPLRIMFPLISGISDLQHALAIAARVKVDLTREKVAHAIVPIGAMVETPSAALTAECLARHCDFLSIGTNDLLQYTFAADRDNRDVAHLYHPLHPAMLRLIKQTIDGAAAAGKPVSLCGDMASDPLNTQILLGLGLRDFSMSVSAIRAIANVVRSSRIEEARMLAEGALFEDTETGVEGLAAAALAKVAPFPLEIHELDMNWRQANNEVGAPAIQPQRGALQ
ncbi:MAG TPA: phosphoenolpyruvate--protein phosphotransferase [Polyangia bacterium]